MIQVILLIPDPRQTNLTIASLFGIAYDLYNPANIHVALGPENYHTISADAT